MSYARDGASISRSRVIAAIRQALESHPPVYFIPRGANVDMDLGGVMVEVVPKN